MSARKGEKMKKILISMLKGLVVAYLISGIILLVLAFLMWRVDVSEGVLRGVIIVAYVLSCFISGMLVSAQRDGKRYLWGLLQGFAYYLVLFIVSMIANRGSFSEIPGILPALFLCCFGGMLGGMLQAGRK